MSGRNNTKYLKRMQGAIALICLSLVLVLGCQSDPIVDEPTPVVREAASAHSLEFGVLPLGGAGLLTAAMCYDSLFIKELSAQDWNLNCVPLEQGTDVLQGLRDSWLVAGVAGGPATQVGCEAGIVRTLSLASVSFQSLVASRAMSLDDLHDKRIGISLGSSATAILMQMDTAQEIIVPGRPQQLEHLLEQNKVDAIAVSEPYAFLLLDEHSDWIEVARSISHSYLVTHPLLLRNPRVVRALLRSQARQLANFSMETVRLQAEIWRWQQATELGISMPSTPTLHMLASCASILRLNPSDADLAVINIGCKDTATYSAALQSLAAEGW